MVKTPAKGQATELPTVKVVEEDTVDTVDTVPSSLRKVQPACQQEGLLGSISAVASR